MAGLREQCDTDSEAAAGAADVLDVEGGLVAERGALLQQPVGFVDDLEDQRVGAVAQELGAAHRRVPLLALLHERPGGVQLRHGALLGGHPPAHVAVSAGPGLAEGLGCGLAALEVGVVDRDPGSLHRGEDDLPGRGLAGAGRAEQQQPLRRPGARVVQAQ
ncbi:hypothetical protein VSR01_00235 [Actinacidiphila sp. DG2A-62]|uniref:hypothetical protein n=1 Tax=Actinacidiphila sp. DG2A-62 TaxID=3108821 RepID=UPI002DBE1D66|nr:hypothetical protein [Actinacidiphila sp. DG2A-62]MEC3992057.1 hypothetical protein [Actinacidiphila sp. DG2A-62]